MIIDVMTDVFLWSFIINMGIFLWWVGFLFFAREWVYRVHSRIFPITKENFDAIHYTGICFFKVFIFACNLVPYIALRIAG